MFSCVGDGVKDGVRRTDYDEVCLNHVIDRATAAAAPPPRARVYCDEARCEPPVNNRDTMYIVLTQQKAHLKIKY